MTPRLSTAPVPAAPRSLRAELAVELVWIALSFVAILIVLPVVLAMAARP